MFWSAGCSFFRAEIVVFDNKNFSAGIFFPIFSHQNPGSGLDPDPGLDPDRYSA